jgi:hypothetical protein
MDIDKCNCKRYKRICSRFPQTAACNSMLSLQASHTCIAVPCRHANALPCRHAIHALQYHAGTPMHYHAGKPYMHCSTMQARQCITMQARHACIALPWHILLCVCISHPPPSGTPCMQCMTVAHPALRSHLSPTTLRHAMHALHYRGTICSVFASLTQHPSRPNFVKQCTDAAEHQQGDAQAFARCLGLARTIYIRCIYGIIGREITRIYGHIRCIYTVLANPRDAIPFLTAFDKLFLAHNVRTTCRSCNILRGLQYAFPIQTCAQLAGAATFFVAFNTIFLTHNVHATCRSCDILCDLQYDISNTQCPLNLQELQVRS